MSATYQIRRSSSSAVSSLRNTLNARTAVLISAWWIPPPQRVRCPRIRVQAFTTIMEAHERARGDPRVLKSAVGIAMQSAEFRRSHVLYQRWNMLRPQEPREDEELMKAACEAIDRGAFSEEAARKVVRLAHQVRVKAGARYAGSALVSVYGEPDRFGLDMHVHTSPGEAADLNEAFADQVVADDELLTELRLNFVPTFMGTRIDGSDSRSTA